MIAQERYKQNLREDGRNIYSYNTNVGTINHDSKTVTVPQYWSVTTSKHINYIAGLYGYEVNKIY